jgi:hypothetical protein
MLSAHNGALLTQMLYSQRWVNKLRQSVSGKETSYVGIVI